MNRDEIRDWIEQWEGRRSEVYTDTNGHPTIGIGFNLDREGAQEAIEALGLDYDAVRNGTQTLTDAQIDQLFDQDLDSAIAGARDDVSNFDDLPDDKQQVVVDMVFNLGADGFAQFTNTIDAIENNDWDRAADEMKDSDWFGQVGSGDDQRGGSDVDLMRNGPEDSGDSSPAPDSGGDPNPDPTPTPEPGPTPEPDPAPEPGPAPTPAPDPTPDPEPDPAPGPEPVDDSGADPGSSAGDAGGDAGSADSGSDHGDDGDRGDAGDHGDVGDHGDAGDHGGGGDG